MVTVRLCIGIIVVLVLIIIALTVMFDHLNFATSNSVSMVEIDNMSVINEKVVRVGLLTYQFYTQNIQQDFIPYVAHWGILLITELGHMLCLDYHPGFRVCLRDVWVNNGSIYVRKDEAPYRFVKEFKVKEEVPLYEYMNFFHKSITHNYSLFNNNCQKTIIPVFKHFCEDAHIDLYSKGDLVRKGLEEVNIFNIYKHRLNK